MAILFFLLSLICLVALLIGLVKPKLVIRFGSEESRTRKKVIKILLPGFILFFICFLVLLPQSQNNQKQAEQQQQSVETVSNVKTPDTETKQPEAQQSQTQQPPAETQQSPVEKKQSQPATESQQSQSQQPKKYYGNGPNGEGIKGNINKKGEKIYHLPGDSVYNRTQAEAWFFTEQDAKAAGYRPSAR